MADWESLDMERIAEAHRVLTRGASEAEKSEAIEALPLPELQVVIELIRAGHAMIVAEMSKRGVPKDEILRMLAALPEMPPD